MVVTLHLYELNVMASSLARFHRVSEGGGDIATITHRVLTRNSGPEDAFVTILLRYSPRVGDDISKGRSSGVYSVPEFT